MSASVAKDKLGSAKLAKIAKSVRQKLKRHERVEIVSNGGIDLYVVQHFMTPEECEEMCRLVDATARPSTLYEGTEIDGYRTSYSGDLDAWHPLVQIIEGRICKLMGIDRRHGETVQGQRYEVGQVFKPHQDYFHTTQSYWEMEKARGGQRSWTAMIYLNEPGGGGETNFPKAGMCITPRTGMLVMWCNVNPMGATEERTLHEGCAVTAGTKYIVTKWFREHFWGGE